MVIPEFLVDNTMPFEKEQFQLRNDKSEILAKKEKLRKLISSSLPVRKKRSP